MISLNIEWFGIKSNNVLQIQWKFLLKNSISILFESENENHYDRIQSNTWVYWILINLLLNVYIFQVNNLDT